MLFSRYSSAPANREVETMFDVFVGTTSGVYRLDDGRPVFLGLEGERIWAIHAWSDRNSTTILAGSYGNGIFLSIDGGASWNSANDGLTATALRTIQPDPAGNGAIICGCEPGRGFRSTDGGQTWNEMTAITDLHNVDEWYLPYSPRAGALRNFYSPPGYPHRLLAAVEVGGLLNSEDGGDTWELLDIQPDDDIHYVTGHPTVPDQLFAALGWASLQKDRRREDEPRLGGVARSDDGGQTWTKLFDDYTRAVIVPPSRPPMACHLLATSVAVDCPIVTSSNLSAFVRLAQAYLFLRAISASVVNIIMALLTPFSTATRTTLCGSKIPALTISLISASNTSKPQPSGLVRSSASIGVG